MKIKLTTLKEALPEALNDRSTYFNFENLLSRVIGPPFKIEKLEMHDLSLEVLLNELREVHDAKEVFSVTPMCSDERSDKMYLFLINDELLVYVTMEFLCLYIFVGYRECLHESDSMKLLRNYMTPYAKVNISQKGKVNLMCVQHHELATIQFKLPKIDVDLGTHYNDGIIEFHERVIAELNGHKKNGIIFLHGAPGTGKTSYIRYLISQLERKVIFVPSDMVAHLGRPEFMQFMLNHRSSVIVIEDAESILEDRKNMRNSLVSNLLSLSDGILSDALQIQFICTFNTDVKVIDEAFFRGGRLIAIHEFKPLALDKARHLMNYLGSQKEIESPTTLANIYNDIIDKGSTNENQLIGFNRK